MSRTGLKHLGIALLGTLMVNGVLFAGLPLLTRTLQPHEPTKFHKPVRITYMEQKPLPPKARVPRTAEEPKEPEFKNLAFNSAIKPRPEPVAAFPSPDLAMDLGPKKLALKISSFGSIPDFTSYMQKLAFAPLEVDTPPKVHRRVPPVYPFKARHKGIEGHVTIRCLVGLDGKPSDLEVLESKPAGIFEDVALAAVQKWQFKPGILGGDAVRTWVQIPILFSLN